MFTINTRIKGCREPLHDWFIIVNGQKCQCDKSVAKKISPIISDFYKNKKNEDLVFATEILYNQTLSDTSDPTVNLESLLNSICIMISKLFCGEEISCQENNFKILKLIGKHFRIQKIIDKIEEYQKYLKIISSHFKDNIAFKEMIELEKILLFEMNETNIETKIKEYEPLIKKISINCFIHFVINICTKNYQIKKVDTNEFIIGIIKNVNKIIPETLPHFLSILFHKFIINNSIYINKFDKINKKEINLLIHQIFADGLMENTDENIKLNQDLQKYFDKKGNYFELLKGINAPNDSREIKYQFFYFIELINEDDIESFQNYIISSQIDINSNINNDITNQLSFIEEEEEKCSLIELSAFFGSIKCFTYLFNKQAKFNKNRLSYFAVAGGNAEIIHICEREECIFDNKTLDISIEYHKHKITKWLVNTKDININEQNFRNSILYYNIKATKYLLKKGININKMMIYVCESNNIILFKWLTIFLKKYEMKMIYQENNKTLLHIACEQNNVEIVKLLISRDDIDINSISEVIYWKYKIIYFVINHILKNYKSYFMML